MLIMLIINMFLVLCNLVQAFFSTCEGLNKKIRMMANNVVLRIFTGHVWNKILTYCLVHTTQCRLFFSPSVEQCGAKHTHYNIVWHYLKMRKIILI